jgi:hypothetical protein
MAIGNHIRRPVALVAIMIVCVVTPARADLDAAVRALHLGGDISKACKEIIVAAERGDAAAMSQLGEIYRNGTCGAKDPALAKTWHQRAAENGDAYAQMTLASHYRIGDGGYAKDIVQAYKWYHLAATAPKPRSRATKGEAFNQLIALRGTLAFNDTAAELQAAAQRDRLGWKMTPEQVAEAKTQAAKWRPGMR